MLQQFTMFVVNALLSVLTPEKVRGFLQSGIAKIKEYVRSTPTDIDNSLVIPACNLVLAALEIPGPDGQIDINGELRKLFDALGDLKTIFLDAGLDYIEDRVIASENKVDNALILPACSLVRTVLRVPDND
ncbi:MAG: hypothetical protein PVG39_00265 [Desulfobacteraceae bacterium]|jgi:hypothetical protein